MKHAAKYSGVATPSIRGTSPDQRSASLGSACFLSPGGKVIVYWSQHFGVHITHGHDQAQPHWQTCRAWSCVCMILADASTTLLCSAQIKCHEHGQGTRPPHHIPATSYAPDFCTIALASCALLLTRVNRCYISYNQAWRLMLLSHLVCIRVQQASGLNGFMTFHHRMGWGMVPNCYLLM